MERLTPSATTEHIHVQQPVIPDVLENCFAVTIVTWPHYEQEWHCVHYFVGVFWLTLFRHTPISCILFVPGPTSSTWKHSLQCTYTTLRVCVTYSTWALFTLLMCKQALIVWCETCCSAHNRPGSDFPVLRNKCSFILQAVAAPPRVFLEWHHTVTAVLTSTHLPVIAHTSYLSCSWAARHRLIMRTHLPAWKNTAHKSRQGSLCNIWAVEFVFVPSRFLCVCLVLTQAV